MNSSTFRVVTCRRLVLIGLAGAWGASLAATPVAAALPSAESTSSKEPLVERVVVEDSGSRIEEVRVRSQTRSIHVQTKGSVKGSYEVMPADPARDSAPGPSNGGGMAGKRVWKILSF